MGMQRKVRVQGAGSVVELCRAIEGIEFAAGSPYVASSGLASVVAFPPLSNGDQIFIKGRGGDFTVYVGSTVEDGGKASLFHVSGVVSATDDLTKPKGAVNASASSLVDDVVAKLEGLAL